MAVAKFQRNLGGNNSTYKCGWCGKRTRETGLGESGLELCAFCYEMAGLENEHSDGHITTAEFNYRARLFGKQYHREPTLIEETETMNNIEQEVIAAIEGAADLDGFLDNLDAAISEAKPDVDFGPVVESPVTDALLAQPERKVNITMFYTTVDGVQKRQSFKTLKGAQAFAHKWAGETPDLSSGYAVTFDGIGKVSWEGTVTAEALFPKVFSGGITDAELAGAPVDITAIREAAVAAATERAAERTAKAPKAAKPEAKPAARAAVAIGDKFGATYRGVPYTAEAVELDGKVAFKITGIDFAAADIKPTAKLTKPIGQTFATKGDAGEKLADVILAAKGLPQLEPVLRLALPPVK